MGREMRICSLLPAATEIAFALGLGDRLVGVSHECDYPREAREKPVLIKPILDDQVLSSGEIDRLIGERLQKGESVYILDFDRLRAVAPDLILTQELCDVCAVAYRDVLEAVERLPKRPKVLPLNPTCLGDVLEDIQRVGEATGKEEEAGRLVADLRERIERVKAVAAKALTKLRVLCLEWLDPPMAAGHWVPEMVELAGGVDLWGKQGTPSEKIAWEEIVEGEPEVIVLLPCGFSIRRTLQELHLVRDREGWEQLPAVTEGRVFAVDGHAFFNRPGPRLVDGLELLAKIIHPELFPSGLPEEAAQKIERESVRGGERRQRRSHRLTLKPSTTRKGGGNGLPKNVSD